MIDANRLKKLYDHISSVTNASIPKNISVLRSFIGLINHNSKFIDNFAQKISQDNIQFRWHIWCLKAYDTINADVISDEVLVRYNLGLPIVLTIDDSNNVVAGVLSHKIDDDLKPIWYINLNWQLHLCWKESTTDNDFSTLSERENIR